MAVHSQLVSRYKVFPNKVKAPYEEIRELSNGVFIGKAYTTLIPNATTGELELDAQFLNDDSKSDEEIIDYILENHVSETYGQVFREVQIVYEDGDLAKKDLKKLEKMISKLADKDEDNPPYFEEFKRKEEYYIRLRLNSRNHAKIEQWALDNNLVITELDDKDIIGDVDKLIIYQDEVTMLVDLQELIDFYQIKKDKKQLPEGLVHNAGTKWAIKFLLSDRNEKRVTKWIEDKDLKINSFKGKWNPIVDSTTTRKKKV